MKIEDTCTCTAYVDDPFAFGVFVVRQLKVGPGYLRYASSLQDALGNNPYSLFDGTAQQQIGTSPSINGRALVLDRFGDIGPVWVRFDVGLVVRSVKGAGDILTFVVWQ